MTLLDEAVAKRSNCLIFLRNDPRWSRSGSIPTIRSC